MSKSSVPGTDRAKRSREGALRMDQRMNEPPDLFAIRAFVKAIPYMDQDAALAAANWMQAKAADRKTWWKR